MQMPFEQQPDTLRPFRLWDARSKRHLVGANYKYPRRALDAALIATRWGDVGFVVEVYDITNGKLLGQYVRKPTSIFFANGAKS